MLTDPQAIEAMRLTAADMSHKYKETSLSVSVDITYLLICLLIDALA